MTSPDITLHLFALLVCILAVLTLHLFYKASTDTRIERNKQDDNETISYIRIEEVNSERPHKQGEWLARLTILTLVASIAYVITLIVLWKQINPSRHAAGGGIVILIGVAIILVALIDRNTRRRK